MSRPSQPDHIVSEGNINNNNNNNKNNGNSFDEDWTDLNTNEQWLNNYRKNLGILGLSNTRSRSEISTNTNTEYIDKGDPDFIKLRNSSFKQQTTPAWRPKPTIKSTVTTFASFGITCIIIGIVVISFSNRVHLHSIDYTTICQDAPACKVSWTINETIQHPIMFSYQWDNFYQNHRKYIKSVSESQWAGNEVTWEYLNKAGECAAMETNLYMEKTVAVDSTRLNPGDVAIPCGWIAKTMFNDNYSLRYKGNKTNRVDVNIAINQTDIAWEADRKDKYKNIENDWKSKQWIDMTDEHFIVWMRPAGLANFRKLWGRVEEDLLPGDYEFDIKNNYDVSMFEGRKHIVLSTINPFGGKNNFLGISYLVVGSVCWVIAMMLLCGYRMYTRKKIS